MASQAKRLWTYYEVDTRIICLWPLLKLHNWTYRDLMNVIRSSAPTLNSQLRSINCVQTPTLVNASKTSPSTAELCWGCAKPAVAKQPQAASPQVTTSPSAFSGRLEPHFSIQHSAFSLSPSRL